MTDAFTQKKYDIVPLLGVAEHVTDPMRLIERSYLLIRKGGIVLIQKPNSSFFYIGKVIMIATKS